METNITPLKIAITHARKLERAARHKSRRGDLSGKPNLIDMYKSAGASEVISYMRLRIAYATHYQQTA